jgi:hypothetical protein
MSRRFAGFVFSLMRAVIFACGTSLLPVSYAVAADLKVDVVNGRIIESRLEGEIKPGDYDRVVAQLLNGGLGDTLRLNSPGGDVVEAMRIGRLIRDLRMRTEVPGRTGNTAFCLAHPKGASLTDCNCSSACFLIFTAGIRRFGNHVGVHRVFVNHEYLREMKPVEAAELTGKVTQAVSAYLSEMGVPAHLIERIRAIPSNEIEWLSQDDIDRYFSGFIPQYAEWVAAKCKREPGLWDENVRLLKKEKRQALTTQEKKRLAEVHNTIDAEDDCLISAWREIRSGAETSVIARLKSASGNR